MTAIIGFNDRSERVPNVRSGLRAQPVDGQSALAHVANPTSCLTVGA